MVGALIGGYLFRLGFVWNGAAALALNVLALALLIGFVREQH
jgi:hypothetical protein